MRRFLTITALAFLVFPTVALTSAQPQDPIQSIRQHYAQINRNASRYKKVRKELSGFSAEGGDLVAYFRAPAIMKMVATFLGESGKASEAYYYWDGKLIFVLRTDYRYDKPLSGKVARKTEDRFYFSDKKLIRWIDDSGGQVAADTNEYQEKQKEYLESSKQFSDGARSQKRTIESTP